MKCFQLLSTFLAFALLVSATCAQAASLADQEIFADKVLDHINNNQREYAKAVTLKYLKVEPDAAPVLRVLAHYYMKTEGQRRDSLVGWTYPDDVGENIIELLNKSTTINPDDEQAWSLLVYTHALQGNVKEGKQALAAARKLYEKAQWLDYNAALVAIRDNDLAGAVELLKPISFNKQLPDGKDTQRIIRDSSRLLRKIAIQDPTVDPLNTVREGLATRAAIETLPDHLYENTDRPILLVFSSQDTGCGYCIQDLAEVDEIARYNKQNGSPLNIVYTSTEPWREISDKRTAVDLFGIRGVPSYRVINDGFLIHKVENGNSQMPTLRSFIDDPQAMIDSGDITVMVRPMIDLIHDQIKVQYDLFKNENLGDFNASAYIIDGQYWYYEKVRNLSSQNEADALALSRCNASASSSGIKGECKPYSSGERQVDRVALARIEERVEQNELAETLRAEQAKNKLAQKMAIEQKKQEEAQANARARLKAKSESKLAAKPNAESDAEELLDANAAIKKYDAAEDHFKALAIAQDGSASVTGMAINALTQGRALKQAMSKCESAKETKGIDAACVLHSVGNTLVEEQSPEYLAGLIAKQQKRNVKKSALDASYKKYRKFSTDRAYAISADDNGNWVYGLAFGKRGTDIASEEALAECEKKRAEKSIESGCKILIINSKFVEQP